jgi:hypothetical protein
MPYQPLTNIFARREEKVARFLTMEQFAVGILFVGPALVLARTLPLLLAMPLVLAAAALTLAVTLKHRGLAMHERLLWRLRGELRLLVRGRTISQEDLAGTRRHSGDARATRRGAAVRATRRRETPAQPRVRRRAPIALLSEPTFPPPLRPLLTASPLALLAPPEAVQRPVLNGAIDGSGQDDAHADS